MQIRPNQTGRLLLQRLPPPVGEHADRREAAYRQQQHAPLPSPPVAAQQVEGEAENIHFSFTCQTQPANVSNRALRSGNILSFDFRCLPTHLPIGNPSVVLYSIGGKQCPSRSVNSLIYLNPSSHLSNAISQLHPGKASSRALRSFGRLSFFDR